MIEYRICWSASSNVTFRGSSEWESWGEEDITDDEVQDAMCEGPVSLPNGLETALEASGFEWYVETRESA